MLPMAAMERVEDVCLRPRLMLRTRARASFLHRRYPSGRTRRAKGLWVGSHCTWQVPTAQATATVAEVVVAVAVAVAAV